MKTVKELKAELEKFDDDDKCFAYEGEVVGIVVNRGNKQGVIYCSEHDDLKETKIISDEGVVTEEQDEPKEKKKKKEFKLPRYSF